MKKIIKIVAVICLSYAILMQIIDAVYSLLSLKQQSNICALIEDKLIPYIISIASMIFCIIHIFRHWILNSHSCSPIINDFLKHRNGRRKKKKFGLICMAILTLVLLGIAFVPTMFLDNDDRLLWQLSNWAWILASILIAIIGVLLTIHYTKGKHSLLKIMIWLGCFVMVISCLISLYIAMVKHDEKIWSNKEYVVYSEFYGFIDPNIFVLYKRDGLIDRRMYGLGSIGFGEMKEADYSMYNEFDLIKEEIDATEFESDSVFHRIVFYRLCDGYRFEQEKNDSLLDVIKH